MKTKLLSKRITENYETSNHLPEPSRVGNKTSEAVFISHVLTCVGKMWNCGSSYARGIDQELQPGHHQVSSVSRHQKESGVVETVSRE